MEGKKSRGCKKLQSGPEQSGARLARPLMLPHPRSTWRYMWRHRCGDTGHCTQLQLVPVSRVQSNRLLQVWTKHRSRCHASRCRDLQRSPPRHCLTRSSVDTFPISPSADRYIPDKLRIRSPIQQTRLCQDDSMCICQQSELPLSGGAWVPASLVPLHSAQSQSDD